MTIIDSMFGNLVTRHSPFIAAHADHQAPESQELDCQVSRPFQIWTPDTGMLLRLYSAHKDLKIHAYKDYLTVTSKADIDLGTDVTLAALSCLI